MIVKRSPVGPLAVHAKRRVIRARAFKGTKAYSAMVRVRNEERYLEPCVLSIVDHVDEVVIIDNRSTDGTAGIIAALAAAYPDKVRPAYYDHDIALQGEQNLALFRSPGGRASPRLLANYYNWCLSKCSNPFIIKWDGDMVATDELAGALDAFRDAEEQILCFFGVNLFGDFRHLLASCAIAGEEPRVFSRRGARYVGYDGPCEGLTSPFLYEEIGLVAHCDVPLYVHLKFCKTHDAFLNESSDEAELSRSMARPGVPADQRILDTVARWRLDRG
jgi:glycosyltransferase involved in cell wall biosynthesis